MSVCPWCQESVELDQVKLPVTCQPVMHDECSIRRVIGSAAHQQQQEDPPILSSRLAAVAAYLEFQWNTR